MYVNVKFIEYCILEVVFKNVEFRVFYFRSSVRLVVVWYLIDINICFMFMLF